MEVRFCAVVGALAAVLTLGGCGDFGVGPGVGGQSGLAPIPVCSLAGRSVTVAGSKLGTRIKNGTPVSPGDCSHVVRLDIAFGTGDRPARSVCSGTLIADKVILSAAHCVNRSPQPSTIDVSIPDMKLQSPATHYRVYATSPTPQLNTDLDLSVIYLRDSLTGATPAELATDDLTKGSEMIAMGYGYDGQGTDGNGTLGKLLAGWVNVDIPGAEERNIRTLPKFPDPTDKRYQETCAGDSGGPLLSAKAPKRLYGVLSGGNYRGFPSCDQTLDSFWQSVHHRKAHIDEALAKGTDGATAL